MTSLVPKRVTLTTNEASYVTGIPVRSFARWARRHGVTPLRRQRIGRSTVTVWSVADLTRASQAV